MTGQPKKDLKAKLKLLGLSYPEISRVTGIPLPRFTAYINGYRDLTGEESAALARCLVEREAVQGAGTQGVLSGR